MTFESRSAIKREASLYRLTFSFLLDCCRKFAIKKCYLREEYASSPPASNQFLDDDVIFG